MLLFFYVLLTNYYAKHENPKINFAVKFLQTKNPIGKGGTSDKEYNIWLVFTKVDTNSPLRYKFSNLIGNLLKVSSVPLRFHLIVDSNSQKIAERKFHDILISKSNVTLHYTFYNVTEAASKIQDIVRVMTPHFSSTPGNNFLYLKNMHLIILISGTYYSDALFYLSLGLHRIAPSEQNQAVMLDCDLFFKEDVALLFEEFDRLVYIN